MVWINGLPMAHTQAVRSMYGPVFKLELCSRYVDTGFLWTPWWENRSLFLKFFLHSRIANVKLFTRIDMQTALQYDATCLTN